jgi:hypothetical protein
MRSAIEPVVRIRSVDSAAERIRLAAVDLIHSVAVVAISVVKAAWALVAVTHLVVATQAEAKGVEPEGLAVLVVLEVQEETDSNDY